MINRPRRLRENPLIRGMIRETRASADSLIYPVFFEEGTNIKGADRRHGRPVPLQPGQGQRDCRPVSGARRKQAAFVRYS